MTLLLRLENSHEIKPKEERKLQRYRDEEDKKAQTHPTKNELFVSQILKKRLTSDIRDK